MKDTLFPPTREDWWGKLGNLRSRDWGWIADGEVDRGRTKGMARDRLSQVFYDTNGDWPIFIAIENLLIGFHESVEYPF